MKAPQVLEKITEIRTPSASGRPSGIEQTMERLELRDSTCLRVTVTRKQHNQYDSDFTYTIQCGTYTKDGDDARLSWAKKLSNSMGLMGGGAYGMPARAWDVEALADANCEELCLNSAAGWSPVNGAAGWSLADHGPVEDTTTTIVDESAGYDGRIPLGQTRVLGMQVPCRGPAHLPSNFREI